jgi:glycosyltransferase involved in cell wall biosynthesis
MSEKAVMAKDAPEFSVVIATFNDWGPLHDCLRSLAEQQGAPSFEVVVVDDGSRETAPEFIRAWSRNYPLTLARQGHAGISAARNRGAQTARGETLVFVDADCKLQRNCLAALSAGIAQQPHRNYFQLRLVGDCTRLVGRAEELRLIITQRHMLQPDGCIRYLNTAGFAMRRAMAEVAGGVFDPAALRAEDTLFMANLMRSGELPWFLESAVVQHAIPLSLWQCLVKDVRSAYLEAKTYDVIAAMGVKFRVTNRERFGMIRSMWVTAEQRSIGRAAWFVLLVRQAVRLVILGAADASGMRLHPGVAEKSS